ncbi:hypothetical protein BMETH_1215_1 [methanotrophic bacterial endosymbiont of Bathymodiolus sp.]|nr:hypothetical protein BMETH_1215_1 [methanotrophic bacterial endosymbiont of Bathymodiolus sp.]
MLSVTDSLACLNIVVVWRYVIAFYQVFLKDWELAWGLPGCQTGKLACQILTPWMVFTEWMPRYLTHSQSIWI